MRVTKKAATIYDIAKEVGVTAATVSLAFSGKRPISVKTREQILQVAEELNYRPNHYARSLVARKTNTIGVLIDNTSNIHTNELITIIDLELSKQGYQMLLMLTHGDKKRIDSTLNVIGDGRVDAVLNLEPTLSSKEISQKLPFLPVITMGRDDGDSTVLTEYQDSIISAINHLLELGHTQIAFMSGPLSDTSARKRQEGYLTAMKIAKLPIKPEWLIEGDWSMELAERQAVSVLTSGITAIMASNDMMAIGIIRACRGLNLSIPGDISVIGFDNSRLAPLVDPPLTTVDTHKDIIVNKTVKSLIRKLDNKPSGGITNVRPELIIRSSTNICRTPCIAR